MTTSVLVLGAGFGGLELSSRLSQELGDQVEVTLIDRADAFVFGFSKLDVMFGKRTPEAVRLPYRDLATPHVRFRQETITAIDPDARRVTTDRGTYEADVLVVALGADYDLAATPGLAEAGHEFYSVAGAEAAARAAPRVPGGHGDRRRLRRPVQVPAGAQRGGDPARRAPARARRPRRRPDPGRDPVRHAGPAVARDLGGDPGEVRRAGHRVRARPQGRRAGPGHARGRARRRQPPALRPVPGHPGAPGAGGRRGVRPDARAAGSRSTSARWPRASRASTRSATSRAWARPRPASSPRARRASWPTS